MFHHVINLNKPNQSGLVLWPVAGGAPCVFVAALFSFSVKVSQFFYMFIFLFVKMGNPNSRRIDV